MKLLNVSLLFVALLGVISPVQGQSGTEPLDWLVGRSGSRFGASVDVSDIPGEEVSILVVGAIGAQQAIVYSRSSPNEHNNWELQAVLVPELLPGDSSQYFGYRVMIAGETIAVSDFGSQAGSVTHISTYQWNGGQVDFTGYMAFPDGALLLDMTEDYMLVSLPRYQYLMILKKVIGTWFPVSFIAAPGPLGHQGKILQEGLEVVITGGWWQPQGLWVYRTTTGFNWTLEQTFLPPVTPDDRFGESMDANDSVLIVGAPGNSASDGFVYVYNRDEISGDWEFSQILSGPLGGTQSDPQRATRRNSTDYRPFLRTFCRGHR